MQTRIPLTCALMALSTLLAGCSRKKSDEPEPTPPPSVTSEEQQAMEHFGEGPYIVCDLGTRRVHHPFQGDHLKIDDEVRLSNTGSGIKLKLGNKEVDVTASDGGKKLKGESTFEHEQVANAALKSLEKHQVDVTKSIGYNKPEGRHPAVTLTNPTAPSSTSNSARRSGRWL